MNQEVNKKTLDTLSGFKDVTHKEKDICSFCKQPFVRYWGEYKYQIRHKGRVFDFCSYTCRNKARHKLEQQKEKKMNFQATTLEGRLREYVKAGLSNEQIAFELNTHKGKVKQLLELYGIKK